MKSLNEHTEMTSLKTKTSFFINNLSLFRNSFKNSKFNTFTFGLYVDFLLHFCFDLRKACPYKLRLRLVLHSFAYFCVNWGWVSTQTVRKTEERKTNSNRRLQAPLKLKIEIRIILTLFCFDRSESKCKVQSKVFWYVIKCFTCQWFVMTA